MRVLTVRSFGASRGALGTGQRLLDEIERVLEAARRADRRALCLLHNAVTGEFSAPAPDERRA